MDDDAPAGKRPKSGLRVALSLLAAGAAVLYLGYELRASWAQVRAIPWSSATVLFVAAVVSLQVAVTLFDGWAWGWLLRKLGVAARSKKAVSVFAVSQFGKYLPGNVAQHVGKVAFAKKEGWSVPRVVISMLLESGFAVGTCALVVSVAFVGQLDGVAHASTLLLGLLVAGFVAGVVVAQRLLARPPAFLRTRLGLEEPAFLTTGTLATYLGVNVIGFAVIGASFTFSLRSVTEVTVAPFWFVPAAAMASWLFGYVVPGAPAGLGVREAGLVALLGPSFGPGVVATAALVWRIGALVGDCLAFVIGLALGDRCSKGGP
ncbi:MAG TPA: lysylphosphatidylglycerol synthase transmembrane domain-containing protein [Polyangiaceae bacterium]|nr:lysylphosphatidylglycerol synthase transmembrane domain-containing protein [Polyangiaceae bacterium]